MVLGGFPGSLIFCGDADPDTNPFALWGCTHDTDKIIREANLVY